MVSRSYVKQVLGRMPKSPACWKVGGCPARRVLAQQACGLLLPLSHGKVCAGSNRCLLFYRQGLGLRGQRQDPGREGGENPRQAGGGVHIDAGLVPVQSQLYKAFNTTLS